MVFGGFNQIMFAEPLNHKKQNGQWTRFFAPYGYMRNPQDKNILLISEEAAAIMREIFSREIKI